MVKMTEFFRVSTAGADTLQISAKVHQLLKDISK